MRPNYLIAYATAAFIAATPAHSTVFSGAFGISGIAGSVSLAFAAPTKNFSLSLNPGDTTTFPILDFTLTNTGPANSGAASVSGSGLLVFTSPAVDLSSLLDVQINDTLYSPPEENFATLYVGPATLNFSTGEQLNVTFKYTGPTDAEGDPAGVSGNATSGTLIATFTDVVVPPIPPPPPPSNVDEPNSVALFALMSIGLVLYRLMLRPLR